MRLTQSILRIFSNALIENEQNIDSKNFNLFISKGIKGHLVNYLPEEFLLIIPKEELMDLNENLLNKLPEKLYFTINQ